MGETCSCDRSAFHCHAGSNTDEFNGPSDVTILSNGDIVVADTNNHRLQVFTPGGLHQRTMGAHGAEEGLFSHPIGLTTDTYGNLLVADEGNNRVQQLAPDGRTHSLIPEARLRLIGHQHTRERARESKLEREHTRERAACRRAVE